MVQFESTGSRQVVSQDSSRRTIYSSQSKRRTWLRWLTKSSTPQCKLSCLEWAAKTRHVRWDESLPPPPLPLHPSYPRSRAKAESQKTVLRNSDIRGLFARYLGAIYLGGAFPYFGSQVTEERKACRASKTNPPHPFPPWLNVWTRYWLNDSSLI